MIDRPDPSEYNEFYATYVDAVPEGGLVETLASAAEDLPGLVAGLDDERALHRYEPGKWSVKEVVGHVLDVEWIFAYRALRFARGDETPLPGMDQDPYVAAAHFDAQPIADLADRFANARRASTAMVASFDGEALARRGIASGHPVTVRALAWILAGHELHHRRVLQERYGLG